MSHLTRQPMKLRRTDSPVQASKVIRSKGSDVIYIDPNCGCPKIKKSTTK